MNTKLIKLAIQEPDIHAARQRFIDTFRNTPNEDLVMIALDPLVAATTIADAGEIIVAYDHDLRLALSIIEELIAPATYDGPLNSAGWEFQEALRKHDTFNVVATDVPDAIEKINTRLFNSGKALLLPAITTWIQERSKEVLHRARD